MAMERDGEIERKRHLFSTTIHAIFFLLPILWDSFFSFFHTHKHSVNHKINLWWWNTIKQRKKTKENLLAPNNGYLSIAIHSPIHTHTSMWCLQCSCMMDVKNNKQTHKVITEWIKRQTKNPFWPFAYYFLLNKNIKLKLPLGNFLSSNIINSFIQSDSHLEILKKFFAFDLHRKNNPEERD